MEAHFKSGNSARLKPSPSLVSEYSTLGGTSAKTVLVIRPFDSRFLKTEARVAREIPVSSL